MLRANFFQIAIMGRTDGQTDGETDGVTALLDLLSPSAMQVKKTLNSEFKSYVFDDVRNKLVSAHCTVPSNVVDQNLKRCIWPVNVPRSYLTAKTS